MFQLLLFPRSVEEKSQTDFILRNNKSELRKIIFSDEESE